MIKRLHSGLPARTEAAARDGVEWIAFDLLNRGNALADPLAFLFDDALARHQADDRPAAGSALSADRGVPLLFARDNFRIGDQQRNQLVRLATPTEDARRSCREDL